jgi:hypothetical protein
MSLNNYTRLAEFSCRLRFEAAVVRCRQRALNRFHQVGYGEGFLDRYRSWAKRLADKGIAGHEDVRDISGAVDFSHGLDAAALAQPLVNDHQVRFVPEGCGHRSVFGCRGGAYFMAHFTEHLAEEHGDHRFVLHDQDAERAAGPYRSGSTSLPTGLGADQGRIVHGRMSSPDEQARLFA